MKLFFVLTSLWVAGVIAVPTDSERLAARLERRRQGLQSQPNQRISSDFQIAASNASHVEYSSNWAGVVCDYPDGTFKSVTGTFTVPTPKAVSGQTTAAASAWVGIDGDTCSTAILQTGVDFTVSGSSVSYDGEMIACPFESYELKLEPSSTAWYEWYPDYAYDFSGFSVKAGDVITLTVTATTTKAGTAVIVNKTTGKTVSKSLTSSAALCEANAEWIVEDFEEGGGLVPFANFGKVTFTDAYATTNSGGTITPSQCTVIDIKQGTTVLTSVSTSSSGLTVSYV